MSTSVDECRTRTASDHAAALRRTLRVGDPAPEFSLRDASGNEVRLSALRKWGPVVIFFYPGDFTPLCTREACGFRDALAEFREAGASVVGISGDKPDTHRAFARAMGLGFPLLSDEDGAVRAAYGVRRTLGLLPGRTTFVIDTGGVVRMVHRGQWRPREHVRRALEAVRAIASVG